LIKQSPVSTTPVDKTAFGLAFGAGADFLGFITLDVRYKVKLNNQVNQQLKQLNLQSGINVTAGLKFR
jgi:hypothetical protein